MVALRRRAVLRGLRFGPRHISYALFGLAVILCISLGIPSTSARYVAVGDHGTIVVSDDGSNWTSVESSTDAMLLDVSYSGGMWVAAGAHGTILSSANGTNWTKQITGTDTLLYGIAGHGSRWIAVGPQSTLLVSDDGATWLPRLLALPLPQGIASGSQQDLLFSAAYSNGTWLVAGSRAWKSSDGDVWKASDTMPFDRRSTTGSGSMWIAAGSTNISRISYDAGVTWTAGTIPNSITSLTYLNGQWLATDQSGRIHKSANGGDWITHPTSAAFLTGLAANGASYVAVGTGGTILHGAQLTAMLVQQSGTNEPLMAVASDGIAPPAQSIPSDDPAPGASPPPQPGDDEQGTQAPDDLSCTPANAHAFVNETVTFHATGGVSPYRWNGGNVGAAFSVSYANPGDYEVRLTDSGEPPQVSTCGLVIGAPHPIASDVQGDSPTDMSERKPSECTVDDTGPDCPKAVPSSSVPASSTETDPPRGLVPNWLTVFLLVLGVLALVWRYLRYSLWWLAGLFTRLRQDRLLKQPLRARIYQVIQEQPGIHFREIVRQVGRGSGVILHHLTVLQDGSLIRPIGSKGHVRYVACDLRDQAMATACVCLWRPGTRKILEVLAAEPDADLTTLAQKSGMGRTPTRIAVKRMRAAGLVTIRRERRFIRARITDLALRILENGSGPTGQEPSFSLARFGARPLSKDAEYAK